VNVPWAVEGQEVKLDGALIGRAAWGTSVAIDPGAHELSATAPGKDPWSGRVEIAIGERKTVAIPALDAAEPTQVVVRAPPVSEPASDWRPSETPRNDAGGGSAIGWWIFAGSSLAVGTIAGLAAMENHKKSDDLCPTATTCTKEGAEYEEKANTAAWVSNIAFGVGIVGVTLAILSGRSSSEASARPAHGLALEAGTDARGNGRVNLRGRF
jgi:hypothetical protein